MSTEATPPPRIVLGAEAAAGVGRMLRERRAADAPHYQPLVHLVDPAEGAPLREAAAGLHPAEVRLHGGPDCLRSLAAALGEELHAALPPALTLSPRLAALREPAAAALRALATLQKKREDAARRRLAARDAARDAAWWARRLADAAGTETGAGQPLRVAVVTSRFSTFLRHAAAGLAAAVGRRGGLCELVLEPTPHGPRAPLQLLERCLALDPDLLVGINFRRADLPGHLPEGVPFVCWIQDAMPHLFRPAGTGPGPRDFVAGLRLAGSDALERCPPERFLHFGVPVAPERFAGGSGRPRTGRGRGVVYVSHQSEPADRLIERTRAGAAAPDRDRYDRAVVLVREAVDRWPTTAPLGLLRRAADALLPAHPRPGAREAMLRLHVAPLAERLLRHETLAWAAEAAAACGLELRLHGRGWEDHPTLARHAAGPAGHADALAGVYAGAVASLHASVEGTAHPRVAEIAIAGGLPLARRSWQELFHLHFHRVYTYASTVPPDRCLTADRKHVFELERHPRLRRRLRERERLPPLPDEIAFDGAGWDHLRPPSDWPRRWAVRADQPVPELPRFAHGLVLYGNPRDLTFSTPGGLAKRLQRAADDPARGVRRSARLASIARRTQSTDAFLQEVLGVVRRETAAAVG
ncbi:hypothetical protein [Phycisphaera mikurensis]|uniref:Uncharacterized protein n=1 Tax=Phycisphaera mikurensis (strain NBRC 102666 / KCTC 22515 / FYK2301M01) TaxID=1142394 RepID=I0IHE8_PHYMF|nr:hypothetical protein [Phycisphaera mikurensis]MBB6440934.1 hypothetical protein [Phycisphaera mikurensis]BAM04686.1 hypothetical protein PSMK_25270 [Phycisphaera mikurensis NBRC 102666]